MLSRFTWESLPEDVESVYTCMRQVKWGGTHRFNDSAAVEAKHRVSLKSHGEKIRARSDTQTEKDLLRVTQEELAFEHLEELLNDMSEDPPLTIAEEIARYNADPARKETVSLTVPLHVEKHVSERHVDHLVHREVMLTWGELFRMFVHCFPAVAHVHQTTWGVYQHALHEIVNGQRYHYWGTDTGYPAVCRGGVRRRRDMVCVSLADGGQHRAEIVCFVKARLPDRSTPGDTTKSRKVSECIWLPDTHYLRAIT